MCFFPFMHDESLIWVLFFKGRGWTGFKLIAAHWCERGKADFFFFGLPLMTSDAICIQLCARLDPSSSYIYHHSQRVMIQASQGEAAKGPDIFIFFFRDLPTQTLMTMAKSTNLVCLLWFKSWRIFTSASKFYYPSPPHDGRGRTLTL